MFSLFERSWRNNIPHTDTIVDGEVWPSVTEVISVLDKSFLAYWRGKIGNQEADRISRESAAKGSKVHELIETFLRDGQVGTCGLSEDVKGLFEVWYDWWSRQTYHVVALEQKVFSKKHKYAGTFDCVLEKRGKYYLTDWKVSKSDDHYRYLQLSGYALAHAEQNGGKIKKGLIVRVDPVKKEVIETFIPNLWKYTKLFQYCRILFDFTKQKGKYARVSKVRKKTGTK